MANEASDNINFIVSNFELKIRRETRELQMMYGNQMLKIEAHIANLTVLIEKNKEGIKSLAEISKIGFSMFDMKRRNLGGNNASLRPVMDSLWGNALQEDISVVWNHQAYRPLTNKIDQLNREKVYEEIYRKRKIRKIQPQIGFTLQEEIESAQAEYLRNHGVEVGEGPNGNQTMEEFCSLESSSERKRKKKKRRTTGDQG